MHQQHLCHSLSSMGKHGMMLLLDMVLIKEIKLEGQGLLEPLILDRINYGDINW